MQELTTIFQASLGWQYWPVNSYSVDFPIAQDKSDHV